MSARSRSRYIALFGVTLAVTSCGSQAAGSSGGTSPPSTTAVGIHVFAGALTDSISYSEAGLTLMPPGTLTAKVTPSAVSDSCSSGESVCPAAPGTIVLALATLDKAGTALPDGSIKPLLKDALVYAITWRDVPCSPSGPPRPTTAGASPSAARCTAVALVDAGTGKALYAFSGTNL
jgi:hypothetical protein